MPNEDQNCSDKQHNAKATAGEEDICTCPVVNTAKPVFVHNIYQ